MILIVTSDGKQYKGDRLLHFDDEYFILMIDDFVKARIKKSNISIISSE